MCCGTESGHQGCCCSEMPLHRSRRFMTRDQKVSRLEKYLDGLKEESKAVKEHIENLKKEK
jgi:hypothetical protein